MVNKVKYMSGYDLDGDDIAFDSIELLAENSDLDREDEFEIFEVKSLGKFRFTTKLEPVTKKTKKGK